MVNERIRHFKATELKLLQERTKLQRRIEEATASSRWQEETVQELNRHVDQIERELHAVRAELRRLEREEPNATG